ncbi:haloacid dehalogenase, IA family protein [Candidatus Vecturithrix granuli]|uniref:Haloacid dehalogenase, IA family protein n=1 Tax=Vecturithrix granuli TaxID=1499967 RepID=A0A081C7A7_VECG1|nr:haloacid dehalogenase, IA family protein [Candidatus Vecturithrix granuli]
MKICGVIFDLGFTLMDIRGTWPEITAMCARNLMAFLAQQNIGFDPETFVAAFLRHRNAALAQSTQALRQVTAEDAMRLTFAEMGAPNPSQEFLEKTLDAFFAHEDSCWFAYPEAIPVLKTLTEKGLRVGMFSNASDDRQIQRLVARFGFDQWLAPALNSAQTGIRKPDPQAFDQILAAWEIPPEAVVMVGDSLDADILGAQNAGMHQIWLNTGQRVRIDGTFDNATAIVPEHEIHHLRELPAYLERC